MPKISAEIREETHGARAKKAGADGIRGSSARRTAVQVVVDGLLNKSDFMYFVSSTNLISRREFYKRMRQGVGFKPIQPSSREATKTETQIIWNEDQNQLLKLLKHIRICAMQVASQVAIRFCIQGKVNITGGELILWQTNENPRNLGLTP